jgi:hypothetical protein
MTAEIVHYGPCVGVSHESLRWACASAEERKRRPYDWEAVWDFHLDEALDMTLEAKERKARTAIVRSLRGRGC